MRTLFIGPGVADPTNYLATFGKETVTFGAEHNVFALYWGYDKIPTNTISLYNGNTLVASFSREVAVLPPANGNTGSFLSLSQMFKFSDLGNLDASRFQSTQAAFEVNNVQVGPVTGTPPSH